MLSSQWRDLGVKSRYFDRNTLDGGHLKRRQVLIEPLPSVAFPQQRFPQEVDIHSQALLLTGMQVFLQHRRFGWQDDIGGFFPHLVFHQRDSHSGQEAAERLESAQQRPIERAEKAGDPLYVKDMNQLVDCPVGRLAAKALIGQLC